MNIDQKCKEVCDAKNWTQRQLASELGINENNLISARKGRRPLPSHALIKLERMRGTNDSAIIEQLLKSAACIAVVTTTIFIMLTTKKRKARDAVRRMFAASTRTMADRPFLGLSHASSQT